MRHHDPETVVRVMRAQILAATLAALHHYRHRHDGRGSTAARSWVAEVRRLDLASGYSQAVNQLQESTHATH